MARDLSVGTLIDSAETVPAHALASTLNRLARSGPRLVQEGGSAVRVPLR